MAAGVLFVVFVDVSVFYFVTSRYWVSTEVSRDSGTMSISGAPQLLSRVSLLGAYWFSPLCLRAHPPSLLLRLAQHVLYDFYHLHLDHYDRIFSGIGAWRLPSASSVNADPFLEEDLVTHFAVLSNSQKTSLCLKNPSEL